MKIFWQKIVLSLAIIVQPKICEIITISYGFPDYVCTWPHFTFIL